MCTHMCAHMHARTRTHTHKRTHTPMHTHMQNVTKKKINLLVLSAYEALQKCLEWSLAWFLIFGWGVGGEEGQFQSRNTFSLQVSCGS